MSERPGNSGPLSCGADRVQGFLVMTRKAKQLRKQTAKARVASAEVRRKKADARAAKVAPVITALRAAGVTTLHGLAKALNARRVRTPAGKKEWRAMQVQRVLARLPA
jgi:hypothetical protein